MKQSTVVNVYLMFMSESVVKRHVLTVNLGTYRPRGDVIIQL